MQYNTGREADCPVCGKHFIIPIENIYKLKVRDGWKHYCSYTCYRAVQKQIEASKKRKSKDKGV